VGLWLADPARAVGGVTGMDGQPPTTPGTGVLPTNGGTAVPAEVPYLDDATAALLVRNYLLGGMPGAGKSYLLNLLTVHAALSADGPLPVGDDPKEGGRRDADPGR
jgi:hypothetical protein